MSEHQKTIQVGRSNNLEGGRGELVLPDLIFETIEAPHTVPGQAKPHYPTRGLTPSSSQSSTPSSGLDDEKSSPLKRHGSGRAGKRRLPGVLTVGKRIKQHLDIDDFDGAMEDTDDTFEPHGELKEVNSHKEFDNKSVGAVSVMESNKKLRPARSKTLSYMDTLDIELD